MMKKEYINPSVRMVRVRPATVIAASFKTSNEEASEWAGAKGTSGSLWGSVEEEIEE